ncbi:4-(cytidine 5'-diphospho)-2-C-methyl-D-erythritol kinase [bacterium]|nr:4-(cytidine 5'-diphospho)-2-C-methyl-D-erythritol kinase [bacterium]
MAQSKEFAQGRRLVGRTEVLDAPAKVNLHLEVLRRRHDGYHEVETVLQAIALFDTVFVSLDEEYPGGEPRIDLTVEGDNRIPADDTNLCWRAARHFCREAGVSGKLRLRLVKRIPAGAGLGGGSSDAAAVLVACNTLFETGLEAAELEKMAAPLGADVPFFVRGGTALGRGIGTLLTPLPTVRSGQFLIVKSGLHLQTQDVYGELKMGLTVHSPKANIGVIRPLLARFPQRNWPGFNRLEEVVLPSQPAVQRLVHRLRELAPVALLCGSGAAAFGAFGAGRDMTEIVEEFRQAGLWVRLVGPHPAGVVPGKG